ncbi:hypothetical protein Thpro_022060 [Acidihalobacter prosperus]|uniref:Uncharacterized protein n=1 Tax=Acidihalobacter prosperus TaxID=160660 RepID=A0A1A6C305_9GAMM|nr:hypothetical protein Thpro_022060 [Acidihalobacter prosperus]
MQPEAYVGIFSHQVFRVFVRQIARILRAYLDMLDRERA